MIFAGKNWNSCVFNLDTWNECSVFCVGPEWKNIAGSWEDESEMEMKMKEMGFLRGWFV